MPKFTERRAYERYPYESDIQYNLDKTEKYNHAKMIDYSAGGMNLEITLALLPGSDINIKTEGNIPAIFQTFLIKGYRSKVKWCMESNSNVKSGYSVGIQFEKPLIKRDKIKKTICPKCQHVVPNDSKFCNECGYNLNRIINTFSGTYSESQSYTPKHLADRILKSKISIIGERKFVTILFADVANFTSISEKLDPEEVHKIMDGCFKILMEEIHLHEGTINQFTGDGVMALFGAPLALEDHAQNACSTALAIQKAIKRYSSDLQTKYGIQFQMRFGINSGAVVVGSIGDDLRMDYTAIGDATNLAARMESLAKPGTILVSPNTYKKVHQRFKLKPLGKTEVKGKKDLLEVYELIKDNVYRPRLGKDRKIYSEMVGRAIELNKLELQVNKSIAGEGSVVNIIGEAGIGKSRLIAELKNRDIMKKVVHLEGRAISIGRNLSFHPIIDLLKHWARISEDDSDFNSLRKLETAIRSVCKEVSSEIIPFVATLLGMKLYGRYAEKVKGIEGEALEKQILKNVRELIIKATELAPLVLVFEDFHWADTSSIELVESLFRLAKTQRILFINVFRPDHKETGERIIETIKEKLSVYYVEINLKPLTEQMSETLIDNMLNIRGLNYGIRNKIVQRSGGNPFFIEEVIRSFIDEGGVVLKNGSFEITDKIEKMIIPHTINDMLMARIDCLEDETRNLVKIASVIGRNFFYRILTEVAKTVEDLDNKLSYLKEIQLIRERKRLEELEYLFKHALVQEAAYKSILRQKRKEIHLYVARSIEKVFNDRLHDFYGMLALHYSRGEDEENSEKYLIKAGEKALRSSASSEALHYYQEALNLYLKKYGDNTDNEKVAMLERNIALAYYNRGQNTEAVKHFNNVLAFWGEKEINLTISGKFKLLIRFSYFIVGLYLPLLRWRKRPTNKDCDIHDLVSDKLQCIGSLDTKRLLFELVNYSKRLITLDISYLKQGVAAFSGWSYVFSYGGLSFRLSRKILEISKEIIDSKDAISVLYYEMFIHWYCFVSGDLKLMEEYNDDLVEENLININPIIFGYIAIHRMIKTELGYYDEAWAKIQKLYEIGNVYEHDLAFVIKFYNNCALLTKYRKLPEALIELEEGIAFIQKTPFSIYLQACYSLKAQVQIMLGDVQEAENTIHYAYELKAKVKPPPQKIMHFLQSKFLYALYSLEESLKIGNISDITKHKDTALNAGKRAVSNSRKVAFDRVETYRYMGIFYWLICKRKKALKWWRKSISEGERLTARVELSRTYFEVGKRLLEPQNKNKALNGITAEEYLKKARTMFVEMDLQWDLDESDKIAASG